MNHSHKTLLKLNSLLVYFKYNWTTCVWLLSMKIWFLLLRRNRHKLCQFGGNLILLFECFGFCWISDCWQTAFVMLNIFCPLSNPLPTPTPPHPLSLLLRDNVKRQDRWNTNQNQMKNASPFHIVFQVLKVLLIKLCKIQSPDFLLLVVFISFYISRYYFSQLFRTSFNITYLKKRFFVTNFLFLNGFTHSHNPHPTPHPLNDEDSLSMGESFLSMLPKTESQSAKFHGREATFKFLALALVATSIWFLYSYNIYV